MFFNAEEDEGDFLSPSSGSKLGALFGIDQASSQGGNETLKYSAPKQPKRKGETNANSTGGGAAPAVLNAAAVTAYKFTDGQYTKQGKVGAAVLGSPANKDFKILLYVSKQQQVTSAKIYSGFSYTVQANNYASFYDDARQSWSIMFDTEPAAVNFSKHVCLAKALCGGVLTEVISQDLTLGEGGLLESGDSAEVKYTGWLLTNNTFGKVFDSNATAEKLFRFKLGKGKVIKGWDIGVVGMKKNNKRLLVVPPNYAYGDSGMADRVPPNSTLIFEIEVVRVKLSKSDSRSVSPAPDAGPGPVPASAIEVNDDLDDATVKGRTRSITEQLTHSPKSDKARLISRMAKMGQPMLPMSGAVPAMADEEEIQDGGVSQQQSVPQQAIPVQQAVPVQQGVPIGQPIPQQMYGQPPGQPINQPQYQQPYQQQQQPLVNHIHQQPLQQQQPAFVQNLPSQQQQQHQLSLYQPIQPPIQQYQQPNAPGYGGQPTNPYSNVYQPQAPAYPVPGPPQTTDVNTPMLMSEARQQNTEVRLAVGKVGDKVDKLLEKLEHMQVHGTGSSVALPGNTQPMENGVLLHNIQKVIQENERLKKELFEKSARIESQNEKIGDLLQRNQRYVEQSNLLLEQRNDTFKNTAAHSQARVLTLEQEKVQIATELSVATAQISSLQLELSSLRKKEGETKQQLSNVLDDTGKNRDEVNILRIAHADEQRKANELTESLKEEKLNKRQLENLVSQLKEEMADIKLTNESLDKNLTERKKKSGEERRKLEEELEEVKGQLEEEIQVLKNKLRKQKSSTDAATAEQVAQLESEITEEWKEKSEKMIKASEDKHKRVLREMEEEKVQAQQNAKDLEKKVQSLKSSSSDSDQQISELQSRVEELEAWKDKYDKLRSQASVMKEKYEERIEDLEEELENAKKAPTTTPGPAGDSANDVKKIMSSVYHSLRGELEADGTYKGSEALNIILNTIKSETLKMTTGSKDDESEEGSEDEEEDSENEAEEQAVVVETLSSQTAAPTHGVKPSKATNNESPAEKKDDRSMASVEADIRSQLIGSGMTVTDDKNASPQKDKEIVKSEETLIKATSAYITGDKGNKYYSEELDKSKGNDVIKEVIEPTIKSSKDPITGDKGNKYYTEELDKGKQPVSGETIENEDSEDFNNTEKSSEVENNDIIDETTTTGDNFLEENIVSPPEEQPNDLPAGPVDQSSSDDKDKSEKVDTCSDQINTGNDTATEILEQTPNQPEVNPKDESVINDAIDNLDGGINPLQEDESILNANKGEHVGEVIVSSGETAEAALDQDASKQSSTEEGVVGHDDMSKDAEDKASSAENPESALLDKVSSEKSETDLTDGSGETDNEQFKPADEMVNGTDHTSGSSAEDEAKIEASNDVKIEASKDVKIASNDVIIEASNDVSSSAELSKDEVTITGEADESSPEDETNPEQTNHDKLTDKPVESDKTKKEDKDKKSEDKKNKPEDKKAEETNDAGFSNAEIEAMLFGAATSTSKSQPKKEAKQEKPVAVEPMLASSSAGVSMGGNPYYGKKLDQSGKKEVKAEVIEPLMASSTASANLGAKPKDSPKKKAVVEPKLQKSTDKITGDKGNKYYSEELDKNRVAAVEATVVKSSGHPTGGDHGNIHYSKHLDQSAASKEDKAKVVEEPLLASSSGNLTSSAPKGDKSPHKPVPVEEPLFAATASSVTSAKPVTVPKLKKSVDHPTGDKGNKYHSEKLDKTEKSTAKPIVQPAIVRSHDHPTGDKGNPHHTEKLDKSAKGGDVIKAEKSKAVNSSPPGGKQVVTETIVSKATSGQTTASPSGGHGKAVVEEPMVAKATSGQTMAAPSSNKTPDKPTNKKAVVEPMISKKTDHVTGDRGNPHHSAKLDQSAPSKPKPEPIVEPMFSKSSNKPTGDKGNPYHSAKLDKSKGKDKSGVIPPVVSRDPPPLEDNADNPLFGDDNTVLDTFGTDFKPRSESIEKVDKKDAKKEDKKSSDKKTPSKIDLLSDESLKGKPPPLFGDEEDEDDLDWLS